MDKAMKFEFLKDKAMKFPKDTGSGWDAKSRKGGKKILVLFRETRMGSDGVRGQRFGLFQLRGTLHGIMRMAEGRSEKAAYPEPDAVI